MLHCDGLGNNYKCVVSENKKEQKTKKKQNPTQHVSLLINTGFGILSSTLNGHGFLMHFLKITIN
jgi:hypothetical protein